MLSLLIVKTYMRRLAELTLARREAVVQIVKDLEARGGGKGVEIHFLVILLSTRQDIGGT